jgi:radical SAM superfamily enzyme YgiQ (UPF0313 family)
MHTMGLSPASVDDELLDLMKGAGFNEVDIGAESACDKVLESLAKDFRFSDVLNTAYLIKKKRIPSTWFIILGAASETRETVIDTLNKMRSITSKWDLVFVSTGIRVYNGSPIAEEILKNDVYRTSDNFLHPVKIEPEKISLEEIRTIAKKFSFRYPNYYFYEKDLITPGWLLITGNFLLKIFRSRQPVWRLLILLKMIEKGLGIYLIKKSIYEHITNPSDRKNRKKNGFSLISILNKTTQ